MALDAIALAVFNHRLAAIAEEMGTTLRRSAFSPNIKERRDYSCAVFDARGGLVAQAAHIPVHLGSAHLSVRAAMAAVKMAPGDVVVLNDPFAGGTHLPDVTVVAPVFVAGRRAPIAFVANRAHHSDIGGSTPGSMALATEIYQEGLRLPPVHLMRRGQRDEGVWRIFTANTRVADERRGDLLAQLAALRVGGQRVAELARREGVPRLAVAMRELQQYSARLLRRALRRIPPGRYCAEDFLDDDGIEVRPVAIRVAVEVDRRGGVHIDFAGSAPQTRGGVNANDAVTLAAVLYVLQLLADEAIPANSGLAEVVRLSVPPGSVVAAEFPAAVAAGNVETSQRIVDVLLRAFGQAWPERIPAASGGSMNNLTLGGYDPRRARAFAYYETIAGGCGGGPSGAGASALHSHMTNTLNTPIEALEAAYPVQVVRYAVRRRSGGRGRAAGGDGVVREIEALAPMTATLLAERRRLAPYGAAGGGAGARGRDLLVRRGRTERLPAKTTVELRPGDRLRIETPGGGGWGGRGARRP